MAKDQKARIAFVLFDQNGAPMLKMSQTFYDKVGKITFRAPKNKSLLVKVAEKYGEPNIKFATIILVYLTDKEGNMLKPADPNQRMYSLEAYIFSKDKFPKFRDRHWEWNLAEHDVILSCSEEKYQNVDIEVAKECFFRCDPNLVNEVVEEAQGLYGNLKKFLGRELKDEEVLAILKDSSQGTVAGTGYNPFAGGAQGSSNKSNNSPFAGSVGNKGKKEDFSDLVDTDATKNAKNTL
jgi:hypothetical protein